MKVTREKAEENRRNVIETSSRLFREMGYDGVGVATLMQAAGLTHGGFYKQFKSKDDLIAQATRVALDQSRDRLEALNSAEHGGTFESLVRTYLSDAHRDGLAQGCALAALSGDAARHGPDVQSVVTQGVQEYVDVLRARIGAPSDDAGRVAALATVSTLVGALVLSRAVGEGDLSRDLLDAATQTLLANNPVGAPGAETVQ